MVMTGKFWTSGEDAVSKASPLLVQDSTDNWKPEPESTVRGFCPCHSVMGKGQRYLRHHTHGNQSCAGLFFFWGRQRNRPVTWNGSSCSYETSFSAPKTENSSSTSWQRCLPQNERWLHFISQGQSAVQGGPRYQIRPHGLFKQVLFATKFLCHLSSHLEQSAD